jgi:DNA-binding HxlR family transcriptional regulator
MLAETRCFEWVSENVKACPISNTLDIIEKKFAVLIFPNMMVYRQTRFDQFFNSIDGMNPKTLAATLRELERNGLVERTAYAEFPPRVEYSFTEKGLAMRPILEELASFSVKHYPERVFLREKDHN